MTIVSIPAGTPITVEVLDKYSLRGIAISEVFKNIVDETWINVMQILSELSWTDGVKHGQDYFRMVKTQPDYDNDLKETWNSFWILKEDTELEFDDEQVA